MKARYLILILLILISSAGIYAYYAGSLDGFTPQQTISRRTGDAEIVGDYNTSIGRVIMTRGKTPEGTMGLVVPEYSYGYTMVARRTLPLFWYAYNATSCTPYSTKNVLDEVIYRAHRYNAMAGADNPATDASIVCGAALTPHGTRVSVVFSDGATLTSDIHNGAFFIVNDHLAKACTLAVMNGDGDVIETSPIHYTDKDGSWTQSQPCE